MSLSVILGPVNSGKTTALLDEASRVSAVGLRGLYVNSVIDTRNNDCVSTHNPLLSYKEKLTHITFLKISHLSELDVSGYDALFIDEAQFFEDLLPAVKRFMDNDRKYVWVAGLSGDFNRARFGQILDLLPLCAANRVIFKSSYCTRCARNKRLLVDAPYSYRLNREERAQIAVGKKYESLCGECYRESSA